MRKEDKGTIIAQIADTVKEYSCFYLAETATLNAEKTSNLRRACFKEGIKMLVVKNALLHKALEGLDADYSPLYGALKGSTTMFFSNVGNAPAKLICRRRFLYRRRSVGYAGCHQEQKRTYC